MSDTGLPSGTTDYPPLLSSGMHEVTLTALREMCVDAFPLSATRPRLMTNLEATIVKLEDAEVPGEVWIDGSFLTEKIDSRDVDLVLRTSSAWFDEATEEQREAVERLNPSLKETDGLDAYYFFYWPVGQGAWAIGEAEDRYWRELFGNSREPHKAAKGIAVIKLSTSHE